MRAKKKFGQNFLSSQKYIHEIADTIQEHNASIDNLLEVGPGKGAITQHIYKSFKSFKAIEIDSELIPLLTASFPSLVGRVINCDFLDLDLSETFDGGEFLLTGNYPYNISSQIIFKMLANKEYIPAMVGMFQKEVAERIVSKHGSKVYGILSVLTQFHYEGEIVINIEPEAFTPAPKVWSSIIRLTRHNKFEDQTNERLFKRVVKQSFNQRRKMLRNTLKSFFADKYLLDESIFEKRPEHLSIEDFIYITNLIQNQKNESGNED